MPPYPEYKASGVPWLGDVPAKWRLLRGKWLFKAAKIINTERKFSNVLSLTLRGVVNNDIDHPEGLVPKDYATYQYFAAGDLVFKLIDLENLRTSRVGIVHQDGIMSPAYIRLTPVHNGAQRYFFHQYYDLYQRGIYNQLGAGVRSTLTAEDLLDVPVLLPPLDEQQAIVRYLDHIDRRVRRYIRAQQRLLALLHEQKQAIIHQAVTRGLDASAPLKPSGVVWLGEVPAHWEVWQVAHFAKVGNGSTPSRSNPGYWSRGEYPWLNSASVNHGRITASDQYVTDLALKECHLPIVNPGSILIAITGQGKTRGTAALLEMEATINQHIAFITPRSSRVLPDYLLLFLRAAYADLRRISDDAGGTKGALTCEDIKHYKILVPPLGEQRSLVETVRHQTERIDFVMHRTQREIDLIREYRTRLIADVVTGKVDVRAVAAALPVEAVEDTVWAEGEGEHEGEEVGEEELQRMQTGNG